MSTDKISIIMAAYNAERTIACAIESVLLQSYTNFELIVIDDCSSDATRHIAERYAAEDSRVSLLCNERNLGVSQTRYNGLRAATGLWIAVLDSDDMWCTDKLEKQMEKQRETGADLLYTGSAFIDQNGNAKDWTMQVPETVDYRRLLKQNILSNSSSLCRKDLYDKYYVSGDQMHEDFALWLKILKSGKIAYGVNEPLLIYRLSASSKSGNKLKAAKMNWNTYRYVGLNLFSAAYYELCYIINGLLKYRNLK